MRFLNEKKSAFLLPFNQKLIRGHINNYHHHEVSIESMINFRGKMHSIQTRYIGKQDKITTTDTDFHVYNNDEAINTHTIIEQAFTNEFIYNTNEIIKILRSELESTARDDKVMIFMREQMANYYFIMTHEECG